MNHPPMVVYTMSTFWQACVVLKLSLDARFSLLSYGMNRCQENHQAAARYMITLNALVSCPSYYLKGSNIVSMFLWGVIGFVVCVSWLA